MQRRSFLVALMSLLSVRQVRIADAQEPTRYLTPGLIHTLLASEIADGITFRHPEDHSAVVLDFKRYDSVEEVFQALRLGTQETSAGVYVRGPVPFSVRLVPGTGSVPQAATGVVFSHRARVRVFLERDSRWPIDSGQVIVVVTSAGSA